MIPVLVVDLDQCDPKKCTAKRMEKFGLGKEVPLNRVPPGSVVLSTEGDKTLSPADAEKARRGLVVLDLTWTNIADLPHVRGGYARRLPYLIAANPVNFGKPWHLNSAEAVLASLIIMGFDDQAGLFIPRFNWAPTFVKMNEGLLEQYRNATDSDGVEAIQEAYINSVSQKSGP